MILGSRILSCCRYVNQIDSLPTIYFGFDLYILSIDFATDFAVKAARCSFCGDWRHSVTCIFSQWGRVMGTVTWDVFVDGLCCSAWVFQSHERHARYECITLACLTKIVGDLTRAMRQARDSGISPSSILYQSRTSVPSGATSFDLTN